MDDDRIFWLAYAAVTENIIAARKEILTDPYYQQQEVWADLPRPLTLEMVENVVRKRKGMSYPLILPRTILTI